MKRLPRGAWACEHVWKCGCLLQVVGTFAPHHAAVLVVVGPDCSASNGPIPWLATMLTGPARELAEALLSEEQAR